MKVNLDKKQVKLFLQIGLAWLVLGLFGALVSNPESFFQRAVNNTWFLIYLLPLHFLLLEYTFPFIKFRWKRILAGLFLIWLHLMFYSFGLHAWRSVGIGLNIFTAFTDASDTSEEIMASNTGCSFASFFFVAIIRHFYRYTKLKQATQQLRIEKQQAELNYLKSQTNPHFLFNTLNNIYSLSRDKSDLAPESILRLSKILRFMLYETAGSYIAIEQELKIMNDYIALEKLRYDESLRINFNYDVEDLKQALPPLLLIPLVENAFKHGVSETRSQPFVDIHLSVRQRQLTFVVKNSADSGAEDKSVKENIGLSNLRRQLELLYKEYHLSAGQEGTVFTSVLKINLTSHA